MYVEVPERVVELIEELTTFYNEHNTNIPCAWWMELDDMIDGTSQYNYKTLCGCVIEKSAFSHGYIYCPFCGHKIHKGQWKEVTA